MQLTRRKFTYLSIFGVVLAISGRAAFITKQIAAPETFVGMVSPQLYNKRVGAAYFKQFPNLRAHELHAEILTRLNVTDNIVGRRSINATIRSQVLKDYTNDNVITLHGWVLPDIIVKLSAMAFMIESHVH